MFKSNVRIIPRLDIKNQFLIKSIQLEGLRKIGHPNDYALKYYAEGADELLFNDCVASLYGRNSILDTISETARDVFIPLTVSGGILSIEEAQRVFRAGADKICVNSGAIRDKYFISRLAEKFGSSSVVVEIQAKRTGLSEYEALFENGRERSGLDVQEWAQTAQELGAGELIITSVDREGTAKGFDIELMASVSQNVRIPVIASGGLGQITDLEKITTEANISAISCAHVLHYEKFKIKELKEALLSAGTGVRL